LQSELCISINNEIDTSLKLQNFWAQYWWIKMAEVRTVINAFLSV